jgi:hypothetical protein
MTPRIRQPKNAAVHSGLFGAQNRTRSPFAMLRASNSRENWKAVARIRCRDQRTTRSPCLWANAVSAPRVSRSSTKLRRVIRIVTLPNRHGYVRSLLSPGAFNDCYRTGSLPRNLGRNTAEHSVFRVHRIGRSKNDEIVLPALGFTQDLGCWITIFNLSQD